VLYVFGFERTGVAVGDLYFVDPNPPPGQEGAERGVRLEVRLLVRGPLPGSAYSARPIELGRPVWRADLLESVDSVPGSLDRAHHHPRFKGWEPGSRVFDESMTADPVRWVGEQLADLPRLLDQAGVEPGPELESDARQLREAIPGIERALGALLDGVKSGELAQAPEGEVDSARLSWL